MKPLLPSLFAVFLLSAILPASAKDEKWVEARSPNFIVVSNASQKQARDVAIQFEQIRELFQQSLAVTKGRPTPVITILAAKDENTLKELLPEFWAEKGRMHPAGIFVGFEYEPSVAVGLSGLGDNPYEAIYHEYYHSLTIPYFPNLPVWASEGLADFYGNSKISDKTAALGMPDEGLVDLLRQQSLIPLATLLRVDHSSPYYNESNKVSIFYAESWALTHYFMLGDKGAHRQELRNYFAALGQGASQEEAAAKAFGDLAKLQKTLQSYVGSSVFNEFQVAAPDKIPESSVRIRQLSEAETAAYRGGFLSLHNQFKQADTLLDEAVRQNPKLALARQNLGISDYLQEDYPAAITALSAAIAIDPNVTVTRFLRAQLVSNLSESGQSSAQVEADLRAAIASSPNFAPAYALLAYHLGSKAEDLTEAADFAKKSTLLQPGNSSYELILARVLASMGEYDHAQAVTLTARATAIDSNSRFNADQFLEYLRHSREMGVGGDQTLDNPETTTSTSSNAGSSKEIFEDESNAIHGHQRVEGTVVDVQCNGHEIEVTVQLTDGPVKLSSPDYTKIDISNDSPNKAEVFRPCVGLKGMTVRVVYLPITPTGSDTYKGEIRSLEIRK